MHKQSITFKHSGNLGDVIYALPSIKKYCEEWKSSADILLVVGAPMWLPSHLRHPSGDVMLTERGVEMLRPLLLAQDYISTVRFEKYKEGYTPPCDVDLDSFRSSGKFNLSMGSIARYYQAIFGFAPDLEKPWLSVPTGDPNNHIVVARSSRYRNPNLDYSFLNGLNIKFIGVDSEFEDFSSTVKDAEFVKFQNFLELASFIRSSKLVIANQTFIYSLAEGLKANRILEPCLYAGNVIPCGGFNFEAFTQESLELAVIKMSESGTQGIDNVEYLTKTRPWQDYLKSRQIPESAIQNVAQKKSWIRLTIYIDLTTTLGSGLAQTLQSIREQQLQECHVVVISRHPRIKSADNAIEWIESKSTIWTEIFNNSKRNADGWFVVILAGDQITPSGLIWWQQDSIQSKSKGLYYADEDIIDPVKGPLAPAFKPDFDPDYLRSAAYSGRFMILRNKEFVELGGMQRNDQASLLDYTFRYLEKYSSEAIGHTREVIFHGISVEDDEAAILARKDAVQQHLHRIGNPAEVSDGLIPGSFRIVYQHETRPLVSIIIPTRNQMAMLSRCIESLTEKTSYPNYEILLIDNQSTEEDAKSYLQGIVDLGMSQLRVLRYPAVFNYSAMNNLAAREARGEYLVLLNNDTAIIQADWLEAMLNHAQRPEVGVVGAKLLYPDGGVQHAGVILGLRGPAEHPFLGAALNEPGYMGRLQVDQQYSAVTAACMMIRKSIFDAVGGLDEDEFKVSYNDIDLCLKVKSAGYSILWTPHALVMHVGSASQKTSKQASLEEKRQRFKSEKQAMYRKWMPVLANDPAYNPNLSLSGTGFELETSALFQRVPAGLRKVYALCADSFGSGLYRTIAPTSALVEAGYAMGACGRAYLAPVDAVKADPDTIVFQRQITEPQIEYIQDYRNYTRAKLIFELDDYLPNLPVASLHKNAMPKDVMRNMRRAMDLCDRVVVSTEALKHALEKLHPEIIVLPNYLPTSLWGKLPAQTPRLHSQKPRVGWAGGVGHTGDLRLIADLVRALSDRVDWVFFGMLPEGVQRHVAEYHPGVNIADYPERLAMLDLDLALAPLEDNRFNACKSNLRLLEYGICSYPVIASDCEPYRCELPVTLVKNRFKDWLEAVEDKLANRDALRREGEVLQSAVRQGWMLEGDNLLRWQDGWLLSTR